MVIMNFRRYNYDTHRATHRESLARILQVCKVETDSKQPARTVSLRTIVEGRVVNDESDLLAMLNLPRIKLLIALNFRNRLADFEAYITSEGPVIALYPDHLLPQAEDAYELYVKKMVRPNGVYTEAHLGLLDKAREFIENGRKRTPRIWFIPIDIAPLMLGIGLEDIDYARWKNRPRQRYIETCIITRATTYILCKFLAISSIQEVPPEVAAEIGKLGEIAYGPLPLARLGEFALIEKDVFHKILAELGIIEDMNLLRSDRFKVIEAARRIINRHYINNLGVEFKHSMAMQAMESIKKMLTALSPIYLPEQDAITKQKVVKLTTAITAVTPSTESSVPVIKLDNLEAFISRCKCQFVGDPREFLTALYKIAKWKEINYIIDHHLHLATVIRKYKNELIDRYFDVDGVLEEIATKTTKLAASRS